MFSYFMHLEISQKPQGNKCFFCFPYFVFLLRAIKKTWNTCFRLYFSVFLFRFTPENWVCCRKTYDFCVFWSQLLRDFEGLQLENHCFLCSAISFRWAGRRAGVTPGGRIHLDIAQKPQWNNDFLCFSYLVSSEMSQNLSERKGFRTLMFSEVQNVPGASEKQSFWVFSYFVLHGVVRKQLWIKGLWCFPFLPCARML